MSTASPIAGRKSYDLCLRFGEARFVWAPDHGVTLTDEAIAWTADDREQQARLRDIAEVHLQTGSVGQNIIANCRIRFSDGSTLLISSNTPHGLESAAQDDLYAAFVQDLHARLAAIKDAGIVFSAGFSEARYRFGKVLVVVVVLFFLVAPTVLLLMTAAWQMAWALYFGVCLVWPFYKVMSANAPRAYDPRDIPPELMPTTKG